jgi:hypothetical protein
MAFFLSMNEVYHNGMSNTMDEKRAPYREFSYGKITGKIIVASFLLTTHNCFRIDNRSKHNYNVRIGGLH